MAVLWIFKYLKILSFYPKSIVSDANSEFLMESLSSCASQFLEQGSRRRLQLA